MYPTTSDITEGVTLDTLNSGRTWTKTLTYDAPATVGMLVSALHWSDAVPEGTITAQYSYTCNVRLLSGDRIVDTKSYGDEEEVTFTYENDTLLTEQLVAALDFHRLFSVDENGITEVDRVIDDSDLVDAVVTPEEDDDEVTMTNPLYYISSVDLAPNHEYLHDNLLARFISNRRPYTEGQVLSTGDFILLRGAEINSLDQETLKASAENGAFFILEDVGSYQTLANFCNTIGAYNPLPETEEVASQMFIIADGTVNLSNNDVSPYSGCFYMLSPTDSVGNHLRSDYVQGKIVDDALRSLKRLLSGTSTLTRTATVTDGTEELTTLLAAYKVYFSQSIPIPYSWYKNTSKAGVGTTDPVNNFSMEYDIWNAYSISEKRNYYYVHQEFMGSFSNAYKGVYNANVSGGGVGKTIAKVCEWFGEEVELNTVPVNVSDMQIHRNTPETTQSSTSYTSGFSWNLSGEVGYESGKGTAKASAGVSFSKSTTYTIDDVSISNRCVPGEKLDWMFEIAKPTANFNLIMTSCTNLHEGARCGRETFTCGVDYIMSFPDTGVAPQLKSTNRIRHGSVVAKCGEIVTSQYSDCEWLAKSFTLPFLKSSDF